MQIPLNEPSNLRYIHINSNTNHVHLLVPFTAGIEVSTDNTCKADIELQAFFEGGAFNELESYKSILEFHLSLLEESDTCYHAKKERLAQINTYIEAVVDMRNNYKKVINSFLKRPSNLYSIQLRPKVQDLMSHVVNPVFTISRGNNRWGTARSPLYTKMHEVFSGLTLKKTDPRASLIIAVLNSLSQNASLENIQNELADRMHVPKDFFKKRVEHSQQQVIDKPYVDRLMGFDENTTSQEYIEVLLGLCAPNLQSTLPGSPFYFEFSASSSDKAEHLSISTQFYLGILNVYCRARGISNENFGTILDGSRRLSNELVDLIAQTLSCGEAVEPAISKFFNRHKKQFNLSRELNSHDDSSVIQKFEVNYRTVTATQENPHMDDFRFLDTEAHGENDVFFTHNGLICTDASNILPTTPKNQEYFAQIRKEAPLYHVIASPQNEPGITIDIASEALMDKLGVIRWEMLPKEVIHACQALPVFKTRQLLDDVAKGKQDEAHAILASSETKQILLRTPGKFIDYSGRVFHCTAYEYAYWAKDTHMQRMLEDHMDDKTKAVLLGKIKKIEESGLAYQQHGLSYQNAHYDMSFVLHNLTIDEFHQLKTMVGQSNAKMQQATVDNYQNISFTATEYEQLKKDLQHQKVRSFMPVCSAYFQLLCYLTYPVFFIASFFITSPAEKFTHQLKFDFHSLITALDTYVTNYDKLNYHQREDAWMKVGKAQRDVPAHVAYEYCRLDRSFDPLPSFNEENLPRILTFDNYTGTSDKSWFPLSSSSSGLGFDFALTRAARAAGALRVGRCGPAGIRRWWRDSAAVSHLDEVRIADLTQSRENLSRPASQLGLVH